MFHLRWLGVGVTARTLNWTCEMQRYRAETDFNFRRIVGESLLVRCEMHKKIGYQGRIIRTPAKRSLRGDCELFASLLDVAFTTPIPYTTRLQSDSRDKGRFPGSQAFCRVQPHRPS